MNQIKIHNYPTFMVIPRNLAFTFNAPKVNGYYIAQYLLSAFLSFYFHLKHHENARGVEQAPLRWE